MSYHIDPFATNPKTIRKSERKRIAKEKSLAIHEAVLAALREAGYKPHYANWRQSWSICDKDGKSTGVSYETLWPALESLVPGKYQMIVEEANNRFNH